MSDETKCPDCGEAWGHKYECVVMRIRREGVNPPTPDPRERGEARNHFCGRAIERGIGVCQTETCATCPLALPFAPTTTNQRDFDAVVADAILNLLDLRQQAKEIDPPRIVQFADHMADLMQELRALRAPAPSEAVAFLCAARSGGWTGCDRQCAMCRNVQTTLPAPAPSEVVVAWGLTLNGEIQDKQVWRDRESAERALKNTRSYVMQAPRVGYDIAALYTHPAPARGVTVSAAMTFITGQFLIDLDGYTVPRDGEHFYDAMARELRQRIVRALTPDAP